ncbi:Plasmodium exported protein, unknown function [Plasmodium malariae]|uniref:Fam-l protein n=1 Tax=Plasmodium malariae TaxID=5858 RepID=A0A1D3JMY7_PLAMA|nr:Plasmodium exported protein, unknown function [Plasmodium malariae]SBT88034.1 Plasmodium exported protein, unknown function [Plasmodium malariae]
MEQKIKLLYFIKIFTFIILTWLCLFYSDINTFDKSLYECNNLDRILHTRNYQSLANYGEELRSNFGRSEKGIPYCIKKLNEKSFTINNEKRNKKKGEHSYKNLLINKGKFNTPMKYNNRIFHRTCSNFEIKFFNALDKMYSLKKIRMNNDESYRKLKNKKYRLRLSFLLLVFLLVLMIPVLDLSLTYWGSKNGLLGAIGLLSTRDPTSNSCLIGGDIKVSGLIATWFKLNDTNFVAIETTLSILLYCVPFFILAIILILTVVYYYKNSIKNQKIKFKETFYE